MQNDSFGQSFLTKDLFFQFLCPQVNLDCDMYVQDDQTCDVRNLRSQVWRQNSECFNEVLEHFWGKDEPYDSHIITSKKKGAE